MYNPDIAYTNWYLPFSSKASDPSPLSSNVASGAGALNKHTYTGATYSVDQCKPPPLGTCLFEAESTHTTIQHGPPTTESPLLSSHSSLGVVSTPVLYQMSAKQPLGDWSYIPAPQLESCLKKDLQGNVFTIFPNFFLDDVWPDSASPCPLTMDIFKPLTFNKIWDDHCDHFFSLPISFTEPHMALWLNMLGGMIGTFTNTAGIDHQHQWLWTSSTHDKQPDGASINRKPDLALVNRSFVDEQPNATARPHVSWTHSQKSPDHTLSLNG